MILSGRCIPSLPTRLIPLLTLGLRGKNCVLAHTTACTSSLASIYLFILIYLLCCVYVCGTQVAHVWSSRDNWGITSPLPSLPEFWGLVDHRLPGSHGRHLQLTPESFNSWSTVSISQVLLSEEPSQEQAAPELLPHAKHRLRTLPALSLSESQNRPWRKAVSPFHRG